MRRAFAIAIAATALMIVGAVAPVGAEAGSAPVRLTIVTLPKLVGIRFALDGRTFVTGKSGSARIKTTPGTHLLQALDTSVRRPSTRSTFLRWSDGRFTGTRTITIAGNKRLDVGYRQSVLVHFRFTDPAGRPVVGRVTRLILSNTLGGQPSFQPEWPQWLPAVTVTRRYGGLGQTLVRYSIKQAVVGGSNVVNQAQQRFYPALTRNVTARLLLFSARVRVRDFLLGTSAGSRLELVYPNGTRSTYSLHGGELSLSSLPRGTYQVEVRGGGYVPTVSLALSRNQVLKVRVISYLDMFLFLMMALAVAAALALVARPYLRLRIRSLGTGRQPTLDDLEPVKPLSGERKELIVRYMVPAPSLPEPAPSVQRVPVRSAPGAPVARVENPAAQRLRSLPQRMASAASDRLQRFRDSRRRVLRPLQLPTAHRQPPREALTGERIELVHVYMGETIAPASTVAEPLAAQEPSPAQAAQTVLPEVEEGPEPESETVVSPATDTSVPPASKPAAASATSEPAELAKEQAAPKPKRPRTPSKKAATPEKAKKATPAKQKATRAKTAKPKAKTTKAKAKKAPPAAADEAAERESNGQELPLTSPKEKTPEARKRARSATKAETGAPAKGRATRSAKQAPVTAEETPRSPERAHWPDLAAAVEALREDLRNVTTTPPPAKEPKTKNAIEATEQAAAEAPASPTSAVANGAANIEELAHFRPDLAAVVEALHEDLRNARTATTKKGRRKSSAKTR